MVLNHPLTSPGFDGIPWEKAAHGPDLKVFQTLCKHMDISAAPRISGDSGCLMRLP